MNKQLLINKIKTIEGLTNEEKTKLTELLNTEKKYGLVWEDKQEDIEKRLETELPVLQEVKERAIISSAPDAPNHVLIEGDNLEALTALSYTHSGKIDVIYIDPPYNTGNKDFVYNDKFVDREDGYRHSKWLSFMNKRLRIAKGLLSDKGVIFISIDDNEQAQLKLLCDEIFGENNFVAQFIWKKKQGGGNDSANVVTEHEYILCYAHCLSKGNIIGIDKHYKLENTLYPFSDSKGEYGLITLDKASIQISQSLIYEIIGPDGTIYYPRIVNGKQSCWRWSKSKVEKQYNELVFKRGKVYTKYYRPEGITPKSLLIDSIYGRTESGNDDIKAIFHNKPFGYPKPLLLIKHFLSITLNNDSTILDFFAGSGTTLHATMQLNNEDGGKRQCILVTNNENGICENVTYERNKRVINGYTTPKGENIAGLKENTLRYYKTSLLPREKTTANMRRLMLLATDMLCIRNNVYAPAPLAGKHLNDNIARYFNDGKRQLLVVYREEAIKALVKIILKSPRTENRIKTYVFSPNSYAFDEDFYDVADRVELCALPDAIYNAYRHVLPKPKKQNAETNENNETSAEQ